MTSPTLSRVHLLILSGGLLLLGGCANRMGYVNHVQPDLAPAPSERQADKTSKPMFLDLIRQMQQQGAYYASLANIDAYRQKYGNSPELSRLQADALRATGQGDAAKDLYQTLLHGDQAGAAWHGLGLIAASRKQNAEAENALAKAVQLEPVNVDYLGDLGYQRLCAGQIANAHEPLAKAAELSPGNVRAVSNLVLWMLLDNDFVQADAAMQRANLPGPAREQVQRLAAQLRITSSAAAPAVAVSQRSSPTAASATDAQGSQSPALRGDGVPESMLERFGATSHASEAQP